MFPISAGLGALSYLTSLLQSSTAASSSSSSDLLSQLTQGLDSDGDSDQSQAASTGSTGTTSPFDFSTLASLLSLQGQPSDGTNSSTPTNLFSTLDSNGDSAISQSEFESGLGAAGVDTTSADSLFNTFDTNGDGSVNQSELIAGRRAYHPFLGLAMLGSSGLTNGATTQIATNTDGSTTTTVTYGNGMDFSITTPAPSSSISTVA